MKIGILSMQKILNYGSFLQALSLKMQLEKRGQEVYFIDIEKGREIAKAPPSSLSGKGIFTKFDRYFFKRIHHYFFFKEMCRIHVQDYKTFLETDKVLPTDEKFDLVIIGSDEVFNATNPSAWGFSTQLFGKVDRAKKVVTYAASCGHTTLASAEKYKITDEIREAMENLSAISVRDANTYDFVEGILGVKSDLHLDPVFISDYDKLIPDIKFQKPYLLIYAYNNRINDKDEIHAIKEYAKANKLEIVSVGMQQRWCSKNITASAFELLSYVKNASCIVTDTFHGTVFSIKYNKKFVTLIRDSNRNKLGGLLNTFGLINRSINAPEELADVMEQPIAFNEVNEKIAKERARSYCYLDEITLEK